MHYLKRDMRLQFILFFRKAPLCWVNIPVSKSNENKYDLTSWLDPSQLHRYFGNEVYVILLDFWVDQCGQKWCFITKVVFWDTSVVWKFWQWCFHWKGWLFNFDLLISLKWGTFQTFSIFFCKEMHKMPPHVSIFWKKSPNFKLSNYFQRLIKFF